MESGQSCCDAPSRSRTSVAAGMRGGHPHTTKLRPSIGGAATTSTGSSTIARPEKPSTTFARACPNGHKLSQATPRGRARAAREDTGDRGRWKGCARTSARAGAGGALGLWLGEIRLVGLLPPIGVKVILVFEREVDGPADGDDREPDEPGVAPEAPGEERTIGGPAEEHDEQPDDGDDAEIVEQTVHNALIERVAAEE